MTDTQAKLAIHGGPPVSPRPLHIIWPRITDEHIAGLVAQARTRLSIYDRSGIVAQFEEAFAGYVGTARALATSSGTSALHSIYYGAGIGPGDEVICCDYGFFATVTPLVHLGARPIFVDCRPDGTICVEATRAAITGRTKAVMVTHMWGQPGRLDALRELCDEKRIRLFEDCSHAHGSRYKGAVVGSLGDAAAWSMQAQKTLWAGEGGVLCTNDDALFERALLLGHFNLRALQEIPQSSPNFDLAFTGTGLKYRAHPLALALALPQIASLDDLVQGRNKAAGSMQGALRAIPGIEVLGGSDQDVVHSYYALVATVDPQVCGFTREEFAAALSAENILYHSLPRQMRSMSHYPLFSQFRDKTAPAPASDPRLANSRRITDTAIQFFVPSVAVTSDVDDLSLVVEAIDKVGKALPH